MSELIRNVEETTVLCSEKASAMEDKYKDSPDPWKNGERGLYYPLMQKAIDKLFESQDIGMLAWLDVGCGGGNVGRALNEALKSKTKNYCLAGIDISPSAVQYLKEDKSSPYVKVDCVDIESLNYEDACNLFKLFNAISMVEVMYYLGEKKPWKKTIDTMWESLNEGTIVLIADGLISYQYREYLKSKPDAKVLVEYTDTETPVCREVSDNGREWNRYLKVRVYQKVATD